MLFFTQGAVQRTVRAEVERGDEMGSVVNHDHHGVVGGGGNRRPPSLKEQMITGVKVFAIVGTVMYAVWLLDHAVTR